MKITCVITFLDGRDRYEAGDTRTVDDAAGARFVANGWASAAGVEANEGQTASGETLLDVQDVIQKTGVTNA